MSSNLKGIQGVEGVTPGVQGVEGVTPGAQGVEGVTPGAQGVEGVTPGDQGVEGECGAQWVRATEAPPSPVINLIQHLIALVSKISEEKKENIRHLRRGAHAG